MTDYERIVNWFQDNIAIAILMVVLAIIMAIPQVREGVVCIWQLIRRKKKDSSDDSFEVRAKGETVTFDELLRSATLDIVRVNAHTHSIGVSAEYDWIEKRYPGFRLKQQSLWFLDPPSENQVERKAFDIIEFDCHDGSSKQVYFEITSFFDGVTSSNSSPSEFARKKIREIYGM